MEEEEGMKKVESLLRGRLNAEEAASKLAKLEAQRMEFKVGELETQLESEIKSRKKADKKLKFLIKKLNSLNIPYDLEKSEVSSVSSSVSSALTQVDENDPKALIKINENGETEMYEKKGKSQTGHKDFEDNISEFLTPNQSQSCSNAKVDDQRMIMPGLKEDAYEENNDQTGNETQRRPIEEDIICEQFNQNIPKIDVPSSRDKLEENKDNNGKNNKAQDADELLALVLVNSPIEPPPARIDPLILDTNVKHVLNALSRAKQRLLLSMERRHAIRVGSK